jgi:single-strand DNA-binding protein
MADINTATLIGHLTRDEEMKYTPGGMAIGTISIAINRQVKKGQEWVSEANYFDVVIFGKQAESLKPYLLRGKQIGVTGFLKQDRWTDQNGQNRSRVTLVANDIQLLGGKESGSNQNNNYDDSEGYGYGDYS